MKHSIAVTWIADQDTKIVAQVPLGRTLMEAALNAGVLGILGECGGAMACATCHVVVEYSPAELEPPVTGENEMLEFTDVPRREASRLSCQIRAAQHMDGIILRVPQ